MSATTRDLARWHRQCDGYHYGLLRGVPLCGSTTTQPVHDATYVLTERDGWQYRCNVCAQLAEKLNAQAGTMREMP